MGEPDVAARQCPLVMDKWLELVIGPKQTMLGLIINTNRLTIAIPAKYLQEVLDLLNSTWHPIRDVPTEITYMDTEDEYKYTVLKIHIFKVHIFKLHVLYPKITKIHIFKSIEVSNFFLGLT
jgi:hypothetical protein